MAVRSQLKTAFQVHQELSLEAAIHEVKNGQSQASAAKIYRISRTTLRNRLQNSTPSSVGAPTKFASHEEDRLAEFFLACRCTERYAFNVGQSLQSGFAKTGLFLFSPEVIRQTVKLHHDPQIIERGIRREIQQDFGPLINILKDQYNISAEKDLEDIKEFIQLKQKGITPGAVLANVMQKDLFGEAPKKQRRQVNRQLNTEPGALITGPEFVAELEKEDEKKKAEKAAVEAKRKAAAEKKKKNATKEKDENPTASKRKASNVKSLTSKKARV
ncbi:hypothetical protein RvY_08554 [Ramazzottius varieornatus]|uniref:HTH psq-type domain-containing protein n=1 Tax=Ramazzottius varieornatus TaxID=947166 RepID=A0A1D1V680_RAMVA|nr:hypothetical protein RvY_08554 [Ramazzottius varieornatus]